MAGPASPSAPAVARGRILAYRVFDAGETIDLDAAQRRLGHARARRVEVGGPLTEGLVIPARPLEIELGPCSVVVPRQGTMEAVASAHVFDFGAVSLLYDIPIAPGTTLAALTPVCDAIYDAVELEARDHRHSHPNGHPNGPTPAGGSHRDDLVAELGDAIERPHGWREAETFTVIFVEELEGASDDAAVRAEALAALARSEVVAKLLLGEVSDRPLSDAVRDDVLKNAFSYLVDDLVIVDWNSALVVEPTGSRLVPFVLELATSQLLEFRYYDGLLDRELARVYDHVEKARPRILRSPYAALTREVLRRFMELTEFTERVDNAMKSVGDFYLARVYMAAIKRFRVPDWRESVEAKLALVGRAYELLKGEVEVSRGQLLEIIVVLLILVEVIAALRGH